MSFSKGRGYEIYITKEVRNGHKEEAKNKIETEEDQEAPVLLVSFVDNILHSIFAILEVYINKQQIYKTNGLFANKVYICNNFKGAICEYKKV